MPSFKKNAYRNVRVRTAPSLSEGIKSMAMRLSALERATNGLKKTPPLLSVDQKREMFFASDPPVLAEIKALSSSKK